MAATPVQDFRRVPFVVSTAVAVVVGVAAVTAALLDRRYLGLCGVTLALAWLVWIIWIYPRVRITADRVHVRNTFSTTHIPWGAIADVRSGMSLGIHLRSGGQVNAFAVGGAANLGVAAARQAHAHASGPVPVRRVDDLRVGTGTTQASRVAEIIRRRIDQASGSADTDVTRRVTWWVIVVTVIVIGAGVASVWI